MLAGFADPSCLIQGGAVEIFAADPARPNRAEAFDLVYGIRQEWTIARHGFAATANLAVRRAVFDAVGGFEGLHISEDMEWGMRAKAKGFETRFDPAAVMRHPARASMADLRRQWDRHISHHWSMQPKTARGRATWTLRAAAMAPSPVAEVPRMLAGGAAEGTAAEARRAERGDADAALPGAADAGGTRRPGGAAEERPLEPDLTERNVPRAERSSGAATP